MTTELKRTIGRRVLAARSESRLTQEQLAERVERSPEAISNIERGVALPTLGTLDRLAKALDVPLGFFFEAPPESASPRRAETEARAQLVLRGLSDHDAEIALGMLELLRDGRPQG